MPQDNLVAEIKEKQELHAKAQELANIQLDINKNTHKFNIECSALNMAVLRDAIEGLKVLVELHNGFNSEFEFESAKKNLQKLTDINMVLVDQLHRSFIVSKSQAEEPEVKN